MKLLREMSTGKDNQTFDVMRVILTVFAIMLPCIMMWGIGMSTLAYFQGKTFDMNGNFVGILAFLTGVGTLLSGGGFAIMLKQHTEPGGAQTTTETVAASSTTTSG